MAKIIGNTTATPTPRPNWLQNDETKGDFIKNKPTLGELSSKDIVEISDLAENIQESLAKADNIESRGYQTEEQVNDLIAAALSGVKQAEGGAY